ncbi:hypothetical protein [Photobacterium sp.]|uniref:hypothetical protein n=1 Tax=Photobacterium sp. TaxID=660 RepID=UPI00299F1E5B|nr:hypothetical protein [Photobacterium sp.]MDX1301021.1 hypothetical protein [Photobacterium sp.]
MNQRLHIGGFLAFSETLKGPYTWDGKTPRISIDDSIDIQTPFVDLEEERTIVIANPIHLVDPQGTTASWGVKILSKEVVGDTDKPKILRIYFQVTTHGGTTVSVDAINFFGMLFSGASGESVTFE